MKHAKKARFWIALSSAIVVLTIAVVDLDRTSPGPLSAVHAREEMRCAQCHGGWFGSMTAACLKCHEAIGGQIEAGAGLHGRLDRATAEHCGSCHSDHHGADFAIVNRASFSRAGVEDVAAFDHGIVDLALDGRHAELACTECHKLAEEPVLPKGKTRFIGLDRSCGSCHEDPHEGRMVVGCAQCHGQTSFKKLHSLDHERHLPLTGGHAAVTCRACHAEHAAHSLEALGRGAAVTPRTCASCHESPHESGFPASCANCHVAQHASFGAATLTPVQHHELAGFALAKPHTEVSCEQCHKGESFAARYLGRRQDDCAACHEDAHGGQFEESCITCHARTHFSPHAFTLDMHGKTSFALTGRHVEAECSACHVKPKDKPRAFAGTAGACATCHSDAHAGFFKDAACSACHDTTTFSKSHGFDHEKNARFAIRGAHAQEDCAACHKPAEKPDEHGRAFGRVAGFRGCATCHTDPHRGRFEADCDACHQESSFRAFPKGFDHGRWAGFRLVGAHGKADCSACHKPLRKPDKDGRTWLPAKGKRCADCHRDPHVGQFVKKSCESCHTSALGFSVLGFDHNKDARFKLDKAHAAVACAQCHKPDRLAGGAVRYRPLGRQCIDCHRAQQDPLRRKR